MQIEILKNVLTLAGSLKKGDVLHIDPYQAQMLVNIGAAKWREADASASDKTAAKSKKAKKATA